MRTIQIETIDFTKSDVVDALRQWVSEKSNAEKHVYDLRNSPAGYSPDGSQYFLRASIEDI